MLRWTLAGVTRLAARNLLGLSRRLEPPPLDSWYRDHGDETLRLDYPLDSESVVFDVGGYDGEWASDLFSRYQCRIELFEPVADVAERTRRRFEKNPRIAVHGFGLGARDEWTSIAVAGPGSSIYRQGTTRERIRLCRAASFIREHGFARIALMKINIEGGEYELLEHLLDEDLVRGVGDLQVQFHDFVPDAVARMGRLQERLARTHTLTYQYPFVWENWRRRA